MKEIDLYQNQQLNESALMRKLPYHPNFVQYFTHRIEGTKLQLFLKQYSGTLTDLIKQRQLSEELFSPEEIISILLDVSEGIRFLHKQKVIHRGTSNHVVYVQSTEFASDLKSDNIFYLQLETKERVFAIGDLDTAKAVTSRNRAKTVIGTTSFTAPEVLESQNETSYSTKADSEFYSSS
jgi:serine/threonine protein kinase